MALAEERIPDGEAELIDLLRQKIVASKPDGKRDAHEKALGLVKANFTVIPSLPDDLKVGLFADPPGKYRAWIRFSNGSVQDDGQPDSDLCGGRASRGFSREVNSKCAGGP